MSTEELKLGYNPAAGLASNAGRKIRIIMFYTAHISINI